MSRQLLKLLLTVFAISRVILQGAQSSHELPRDCEEVQSAGNHTSGIHTIYLTNSHNHGVQVWCDMETDGGGWTVFQRRMDGSGDFYRSWDQYAMGFGNLSREFWLGNQILHYLTTSDWYMLRVDLADFNNNTRYAEYDIFSVGPPEDRYRAYVSGYSGNAGDDMSLTSGYRFSTYDRDYDVCSCNCARSYKGGWWYAACHRANLNGLYLNGHVSSYANGVVTYSFKGFYYSLKTTTMMVRKGWPRRIGQIVSV